MSLLSGYGKASNKERSTASCAYMRVERYFIFPESGEG